MHGYSRLGNGVRANGNLTPSPPSSPRFRHGRNGKGSATRGPKPHSFTERLVYILVSTFFRRRGILLFMPLLYISGMLMYMGRLNFEVPGVAVAVHRRPPPGSTYRSPQVFEKLWPFMQFGGNISHAHAKLGIF